MHLVDWVIVAGLLAALTAAALYTGRFTRSVSAFLAANRCGGRYIISMAYGMAGLGVITLVGFFEQNYEVGYTSLWWGPMTEPAMIILALSGWVVYRFRQTRAMTMAQFFEMRYSRRFRVFAGLVAYLSGIINFGIFPAVGARFFIALCGLPTSVEVAGASVSMVAIVMILLLSISLLFTFLGGHIAVMVTDFLQGVFVNIVFIVVMLFLLRIFRWEQIGDALLQAPAEESLVHPFHLGEETHFNLGYYLISVVIVFYCVLGWQGTQGYNCCAKDAHEAKMAGILNGWRFRVLMLIVVVVPVAVRALQHDPAFGAEAAAVETALAGVESETLRNQVRTPLALAALLPTGLLGLTCAAMLAAFISTHDTYLHSWGSILVQDVILPFRRRPFTPRQHLWLLRASIFGVAVFIFMFSLLFQQTQYIQMFLAITGAVFVGGAGSTIIGGLYWRGGTTAGAWAAMTTGMVLSIAGIVVKQIDPGFPLTGQVMTFWAIVASIGTYVLVSLVDGRRSGREAFDLDSLLHRGRHAVAGERSVDYAESTTWLERLGISREFTGRDRLVTYVTLAWPVVWTVIFVAGTIYNVLVDVPDASWLAFWRGYTWFTLVTAAAVTIWFAVGGLRDLRFLFTHLREREDIDEDGRVDVDPETEGSPDA
jgi:SSS family solute:Na+ symporter